MRVFGARKDYEAEPEGPALVHGQGAIDESNIATGIRQLAAVISASEDRPRRSG